MQEKWRAGPCACGILALGKQLSLSAYTGDRCRKPRAAYLPDAVTNGM